MTQMQPMDTAPRDGTHILGWSDEWEHDGWLTFDRGFYECWWTGRGWQSDRYNYGEFGIYEQPTLWCPLPTLPTDTGERQ